MQKESLSLSLHLDLLFKFLIYIIALFNINYHLALYFNFSFNQLSIFYSLQLLVVIYFHINKNSDKLSKNLILKSFKDINFTKLILIGFICGIIALITCRPDADDTNYFSRALVNFSAPNNPIQLFYPFPFAGKELLFIGIDSLLSYTHFCCYISKITGITPIYIYHTLMPFCLGFIFPFAYYYLLKKFEVSSSQAVFGVLLIVVLCLVDGSTHRSIGNFSFVRIWQGKVIIMMILTPYIMAKMIDNFHSPNNKNYIFFTILSIASISFSLMSSFYLPFLALFTQGALLINNISYKNFKNCFISGLSISIFPVFLLGPFYFDMTNFLKMIKDSRWTIELYPLIKFVFGEPIPLALTFLILSILGIFLLKRKKTATLLLTWTLLIFIIIGVPPFAEFISQKLTSGNNFWRLLYLLPIQISVGLFGAFIYIKLNKKLKILTAIVLIVLPYHFYNKGYDFSPFTHKKISFSIGPKVPKNIKKTYEKIIKNLEPGSMFAHRNISIFLPLLSTKFPQGNLRNMSIYTSGYFSPTLESSKQRIMAYRYINRARLWENYTHFNAFRREILQNYKYLIIPIALSQKVAVRKVISESKYEKIMILNNKLICYKKTGSRM